MKILFVCLGNICRSPLAVGLLRKQVDQLNLNWLIDSTGLANKYVGCAADFRVVTVAKRHGIDLSHHIARKFQASDFDQYDMIITMDNELASRLRAKASDSTQLEKVWLLSDFLVGLDDNIDMPDPYFWDTELFDSLFIKMDLVCKLIVERLNTLDTLDFFEDRRKTNALALELGA